jgi:4-oxalocrotonate tautomerase
MPVITVEGPPVDDIEKKRSLVRSLTTAAATGYGLPEAAFIVILHETNPDCVGSGGQLLVDRQPSNEV